MAFLPTPSFPFPKVRESGTIPLNFVEWPAFPRPRYEHQPIFLLIHFSIVLKLVLFTRKDDNYASLALYTIHVQYTRPESDRLGYATVRLTGSPIARDLEKYIEEFTEGVKCWRIDSVGHGRTQSVSLCVGSTERKSDRERLRKIRWSVYSGCKMLADRLRWTRTDTIRLSLCRFDWAEVRSRET